MGNVRKNSISNIGHQTQHYNFSSIWKLTHLRGLGLHWHLGWSRRTAMIGRQWAGWEHKPPSSKSPPASSEWRWLQHMYNNLYILRGETRKCINLYKVLENIIPYLHHLLCYKMLFMHRFYCFILVPVLDFQS